MDYKHQWSKVWSTSILFYNLQDEHMNFWEIRELRGHALKWFITFVLHTAYHFPWHLTFHEIYFFQRNWFNNKIYCFDNVSSHLIFFKFTTRLIHKDINLLHAYFIKKINMLIQNHIKTQWKQRKVYETINQLGGCNEKTTNKEFFNQP